LEGPLNFINIAGHLGADPEVRFTSSGKKVTTLRVATRSRKGQKDDTIWWRVTLWDERFDKMVPHLKKGSAVIVFGEMHKPELFNDREGKPQISMEITAVQINFSPFGKPGGSERSQEGASHHAGPAAPFGTPHPEGVANPYMSFGGKTEGQGTTVDDEVPF